MNGLRTAELTTPRGVIALPSRADRCIALRGNGMPSHGGRATETVKLNRRQCAPGTGGMAAPQVL